ncbi:chromatin assembly factor 1 subunit A [Gastrophryne carolinensis]
MRSSTTTQKKMVQARLPFKRLNPVPRENQVTLQGKRQKVASIDVSPVDVLVEDVENGCKMETEDNNPPPKLINGKGPLDIYVKKVSKACHVVPSVTIDLTEDSNSGLDHPPVNERLQSSLANGTVLTDCDFVGSKIVNDTVNVLKDSIKQLDKDSKHSVHLQENLDTGNESYSTVSHDEHNTTVEECAEMCDESFNPTEVSFKSADGDTFTSPVRTVADDADLLTDDGSTPSSSNSSSSSPEVLDGTALKGIDASPTVLHKGYFEVFYGLLLLYFRPNPLMKCLRLKLILSLKIKVGDARYGKLNYLIPIRSLFASPVPIRSSLKLLMSVEGAKAFVYFGVQMSLPWGKALISQWDIKSLGIEGTSRKINHGGLLAGVKTQGLLHVNHVLKREKQKDIKSLGIEGTSRKINHGGLLAGVTTQGLLHVNHVLKREKQKNGSFAQSGRWALSKCCCDEGEHIATEKPGMWPSAKTCRGTRWDQEQDTKKQKLQAEREERDRLKEEVKLAKERAKEEAKKKKDEEKEQRAKEKREKKDKEDREKAEKLRLKEEKKKEKLEALEAKQEEKRKKEEEKRVKEEEKRMKAEKAEITRFLQKSKTFSTPKLFAQSCGKFAPFEIKKNMAIAPLCRVEFDQENSVQLDEFLKEQSAGVNFLLELKTRKVRKMGRTVIPEVPPTASDTEDVQIIIETESVATLPGKMVTEECSVPERRTFGKMKLLQFSENHRPAYWGTWSRSSTVICPRKPWAQDTVLLDYEVDSDDEWEEEEPGESLSHSEGEDEEEEPKEDEDDDDGFFVPHGYLSEDEGGVSDEECKNPENQKVHQRLKAKEWDELQIKGKRIHVLKPVVIGCTWLGGNSAEIKFLQKFAACILDTVIPIEEDLPQENTSRSPKDKEILIHLLPLLHGNVNGSKIIIQEFQECCKRGIISLGDTANVSVIESASPNSRPVTPSIVHVPSKARLKRIISENSVYEKRPEHRMCWYVHADVLKSFQLENLPVPCQWTYVTQVNLSNKDETGNSGSHVQVTPTSGKRKSAGSMPITKFMKKATEMGVAETDGFQADTEEEEDDDEGDDCMIVEEPNKKDTDDSSILCKMEVTLSEESATA